MKICIDPGHGGTDPGAVGPNGLKESVINLAVSQHLAASLEPYEIQTLLTRSGETALTLGTRCELANDWGADYFISIHCNSNSHSAVGIETLYKTDLGADLASPIQSTLILRTGDVDRGLKHRTNLHVLNATHMPAILIEIGFISNPPTESKLKTEAYQDQIAQAIKDGLLEFLKELSEQHLG